jgi:type I restriction enzyme S subunit
MMGWQKTSLDNICLRITDGAHHSPRSVDLGKPMASVKDLTPFGITLETCRHISEENFVNLIKQGCMPEVGDVLVAKDGASALDTVCEIKKPIEAVLLSSVAILRPNPDKVLSSFLRFYLDCEPIRQYMKNSFTSGAAIPRVVLKDFRKVEINLPPLEIQRKIASILSAYDDLIENNTRRIKILEEMAQAIHREWFVNFRFPGHEQVRMVDSPLGKVPEGWAAVPFEDLLSSMTGGDWGAEQPTDLETAEVVIVRGTDFNEVAYGGQLRVPLRYIKPSSLITRGLKVGDVVIENSINAKSRCIGTTLLVDSYTLKRLGRDSVAASFCKVFRMHEPRLAPLVHLHVRYLRENARMEYYQNVAANGIGNFQAQKFAKEEHLVFPADEAMCNKLISSFEALFQSIGVLSSQLANLRETRDLLLPKLISGKVDASKMEISGEAVA